MPEITLRNITKRWGNFFGVDNVSLDIPDNSFITLLGPSGCGKTTILRMIAGLETPTEGQIKIGDRVVFDSAAGVNVPANKRKVGFLFQNYALWPNMTVFQNISFGLKNVHEEMPNVDVTAKQTGDLLRAVSNGKKVREEVESCRDKDGKLDAKRAYIKLIDAFTLSMFTAKELFNLKIHEASDPAAAGAAKAAELEKKLEGIRDSYKAKGQSLNEEYQVVGSDGQVVKSVRKLTPEEIDARVRRVSRIVKIGLFMDRYPAELSGGQQQRVAIARTLAPEPQVLFMDEPLSNLDAKLRLEMRYELQRLHVETGSTFVYVTHDQMEAMTLATRICLINNGVLQQYEAPLKVYNRPENLFAADFVGNPSINFVDAKGRQQGEGVELTILDGRKARFIPNEPLNLESWFADRDRQAAEKAEAEKARLQKKGAVEKSNKDEVFQYHVQKVEEEDYSLQDTPVLTNEDLVLAFRPEAIDLAEEGAAGAMDATIYGAMPTGMESTLKLRVGGFLLTGVVFGSTAYQIGQKTRIVVSGSDVLLFDRKSGRRISAGRLEIE
ncbi:MAG: ABC transporter ATP-binding protein [Lachnospiraceae bacterium]|nr:ABC transporter ATP-binding protein [Lachnospiraceae bacterium]